MYHVYCSRPASGACAAADRGLLYSWGGCYHRCPASMSMLLTSVITISQVSFLTAPRLSLSHCCRLMLGAAGSLPDAWADQTALAWLDVSTNNLTVCTAHMLDVVPACPPCQLKTSNVHVMAWQCTMPHLGMYCCSLTSHPAGPAANFLVIRAGQPGFGTCRPQTSRVPLLP